MIVMLGKVDCCRICGLCIYPMIFYGRKVCSLVQSPKFSAHFSYYAGVAEAIGNIPPANLDYFQAHMQLND